jgi:hypothetical protein
MQADPNADRGKEPVVCILPVKQQFTAIAATTTAAAAAANTTAGANSNDAAQNVNQLVMIVQTKSIELWDWRGQQETFVWSQELALTLRALVSLVRYTALPLDCKWKC